MKNAILLVEDNPTTRKMVRYALQHHGHTVLEAGDGKTALEMMEEHRPSIVLLDLVLPDISGFSLVPQLREKAGSSDTTIVAFSGFLSKLEEARLAAVGFDEVIAKPIEPDRLVAQIEAYLPQALPEIERFGLGKSVLVVDDDPLQLKLIRFRMQQLGFEVVTATDGVEALELAAKTAPDVVIADALMPQFDGFELAVALRRRPEFSLLPVLLVTSSYIESADRELAKRAGATDLVVRTPELSELIEMLEHTLTRSSRSLRPEPLAAVEEEHTRRVVKQLERQVHLNSGLAVRCAALGAELAVLTRISDVVLKNRSLDVVLDEALAACFDAGGISVGALYHLSDGQLNVRSLGTSADWRAEDLDSFFGHADLLHACITSGASTHVPSAEVPEEVACDLLPRCGARGVLIIPLRYLDSPLGALVMFAGQHDLDQPDWSAFAQAIANQISQVLALTDALSARSKAEQIAQERTAFLDALLEQAPDSVLYVDPEGMVRYASSGASGAVAQDVVGTSMYSLTAGSTAEERRARLQQVVSRGEAVSWEETLVGGDGGTSSYWFKMGPIRRDGVVEGAVILARNISEKKAADAQLIAADRMISVGTLAAGVAHEINNPLTAVVANLEIALSELKTMSSQTPVPYEIINALGDAREAGDRIRTIVRDLRVFSRAEEDKRGAVDVERLLESTLRMAWNELRHRARVVKDYANVPAVEANDARLGQVFLNLVINAAHAIPEGNCEANVILVSTAVDSEGRVVVRIKDSGSGIPKEVQTRIFTPFFTTKPVGVGTGLGLSICRRIVESLDGTISFVSEPGRGTEFSVVLPRARFHRVDDALTSPSVAPVRRGRVLVVDDEPMVGNTLRRMLSDEHEVVVRDSGVEALDTIQRGERFDVILCDLMMPQVTGMQLHNAVQEIDSTLSARMVFMTGGAFTPWARRFLESVTNHRLEKPFNRDGIRTLVNSLIR